jgi:hypothetical protein
MLATAQAIAGHPQAQTTFDYAQALAAQQAHKEGTKVQI